MARGHPRPGPNATSSQGDPGLAHRQAEVYLASKIRSGGDRRLAAVPASLSNEESAPASSATASALPESQSFASVRQHRALGRSRRDRSGSREEFGSPLVPKSERTGSSYLRVFDATR